MNTDLISSRFLYEATNQRWSSFLHEATGKTAGSLGVGRRGTTGAATAADGTVTRSSQAAGRGLAVNQLVRKPYLQFLCLAC